MGKGKGKSEHEINISNLFTASIEQAFDLCIFERNK